MAPIHPKNGNKALWSGVYKRVGKHDKNCQPFSGRYKLTITEIC